MENYVKIEFSIPQNDPDVIYRAKKGKMHLNVYQMLSYLWEATDVMIANHGGMKNQRIVSFNMEMLRELYPDETISVEVEAFNIKLKNDRFTLLIEAEFSREGKKVAKLRGDCIADKK